MSTAKENFKMQHITEAQLREVYASDQEMYPAPLTFDSLRSWVQAAPEFSISFYPQIADTSATAAIYAKPMGIIIVLPLLRPHWENLVVGKVKEIDIDAESMFPCTGVSKATDGCGDDKNGSGLEVGLHVFHVEKFSTAMPAQAKSAASASTAGTSDAVRPRKRFAELAIEEALSRASSVTTDEGKKWKVCGLSALTATEAGKRSFLRMGYTPNGYKEMFVTTGAGDGMDGIVKMIYEYPGTEKGLEQRSDGSDLVHGASVSQPSEMVVKYL